MSTGPFDTLDSLHCTTGAGGMRTYQYRLFEGVHEKLFKHMHTHTHYTRFMVL